MNEVEKKKTAHTVPGFSSTVASDLKKLNQALIERKASMNLTSSDRNRVFSFSSSR